MSRPWSDILREEQASEKSNLYIWKPIPLGKRLIAATYVFSFGTAFTTGVFLLVGWREALPWGEVTQIALVFAALFAVAAVGVFIWLTVTGMRVNRYLDDSGSQP